MTETLVGLRSRRQIAPFALHRPATLAEAVALHRQPGVNAFLAGGTDLIDWLKHGHVIDRLIRLDGLPVLATITAEAGHIRIGAMVTHAAIAACSLMPDLSRLWQQVANPRVRFTGTIGGNVMAARCDYDGVPALLALGASAELAVGGSSDSGVQPMSLEQLSAAAQPGDITATPLLTGFRVPTDTRLFAERSLRPALSLWLGLTTRDRHVRAIRIAVGSAHPQPVCVTLPLDLPITGLGAAAADITEAIMRQLPEPVTDSLATAAYRRRMTGVLTRRILIRAGDGA